MHTYLCATASQNRCRFGAKFRGCDKCWGHIYAQSYTNAHSHTHIPVCQQRLKIDADLARITEAALRVGGTHTHIHTPTHTRIHTQSYTNAHTYTHTHVYTHTREPTASQIGYGIGANCRSRGTCWCPRVGVHWETSVKPPAIHRVCVCRRVE